FLGRNSVFVPSDQEEGVGVQQVVLRTDQPPSRISGSADREEEFVPRSQIERGGLRFLQDLELFLSATVAEGAALQVLAAEDRVDVVQSGSLESESDAHPKQLVRLRKDVVVVRRRGSLGRHTRLPAELLELP